MSHETHKTHLLDDQDGTSSHFHEQNEIRYAIPQRIFWLEASRLRVFQEYDKKPGSENDPDVMKYVVRGVARLEGSDTIRMIGDESSCATEVTLLINGWTEGERNRRLKLYRAPLQKQSEEWEERAKLQCHPADEVLPNIALSYGRVASKNDHVKQWRAEIRISDEVFTQMVLALIDGSVKGLTLGISFRNILANATHEAFPREGFHWHLTHDSQAHAIAWGLITHYSLLRADTGLADLFEDKGHG